MKYITIEELENRKKILFDRRKKIEKQLEKDDKDKKFKLTMAFNSSLLHDIDCIIGEISFLIDHCNMKQDSSLDYLMNVFETTRQTILNDLKELRNKGYNVIKVDWGYYTIK